MTALDAACRSFIAPYDKPTYKINGGSGQGSSSTKPVALSELLPDAAPGIYLHWCRRFR
jgi:hypothetical protein